MKLFALAVVVLVALALPASADDKKADPPVALKLVAKTDKYKFDGGGKTAAEFKQHLEGLAKAKGERADPPKPPAVDLVLRLTNTSDREVTVYVDGVVALDSGLLFTADFKAPEAVALAPGKSHDLPVKRLADGKRGGARNVYWTGPGEYKLSAKYALSDKDGGKGPELKSEPVKITVTEK